MLIRLFVFQNAAKFEKLIQVDLTKGIDDAVRANIKLSALTISEWYATLQNEPLEEVNRFWKEVGFTP